MLKAKGIKKELVFVGFLWLFN